jgi:hypothetical protein
MQLTPRGLAIDGKESRGDVEVLNAADGGQLGHRLVDPEPTVRTQASSGLRRSISGLATMRRRPTFET